MSKLPRQSENPKGLHHRYKLQKFDKEQVKCEGRWIDVTLFKGEYEVPEGRRRIIYKDVDDSAEYFILRLDEGGKDLEHIKACRIGIHAYADAIEHHLPELAKDLRERYPLLSSPATPVEGTEPENNGGGE